VDGVPKPNLVFSAAKTRGGVVDGTLGVCERVILSSFLVFVSGCRNWCGHYIWTRSLGADCRVSYFSWLPRLV
jgi:hypothetical protein